MASYKIAWKRSAEKELRKFDRPVIAQIVSTVQALMENPYPDQCKKLRGSQYTFRL